MAHAGGALLCEADALVPVPLHQYRLFRRRYNQAALLAEGLSRLTGIPAVLDALVRSRATASLGEKSAVERAAAVRAAFSVRSTRLSTMANCRLVLVDDVLTSGATANACARVLLAGDARSVDVLVVARVPDPRHSQ
jgi:ComF family protein